MAKETAKKKKQETDAHGNYDEPVTMFHPEHWHDSEHEKTLDNGQPDTATPATKQANPTMEVTRWTAQEAAARTGWRVGTPQTRKK